MVYLAVILLIFVTDLVIKNIVEKKLEMHKQIPALNNKIYLTKYHNKGAFLNSFDSRREVVMLSSIVLTVFAACLFIGTFGKKGKTGLRIALSLLLGGALSNTYDRIERGYVVDYLGFQVKNQKLRNVIFNISDFFIIIGAFLTAIFRDETS